MLSRREFLTALVAAWPVLAGCQRAAGAIRRGPDPGPSYAQPNVETWVRVVCSFCPVGCPLELGVSGGEIVSLRGVPTSQVNFGRLCAKGALMPKTVGVRSRAKAVLVRKDPRTKGRAEGLEESAWDKALEQVAERIRKAGPQGVYFYLGAQLSTETLYLWNRLAKGFLGTNNLGSSSFFSQLALIEGLSAAFGTPAVPGSFADLDEADVLLIAGANLADSHPALFYRLMANKRVRGARVILVDPRISASAVAADLHLRPRPGTDAVLLNAIANVLVGEARVNEGFLAGHVAGYPEFRQAVQAFPPTAAAGVTGVPADEIVAAARMIGGAKTLTSLFGAGIAAAPDGPAAVQAVANLHLITGQLGRPGSGLLSLTGAANAQGAQLVGAYPHLLPAGRTVTDDEARRQMEEIWGLPQGQISPVPGPSPLQLPDLVESGRIQVLVVVGSNPAVSMPDLHRWRRTLERLYVVVVDSHHPTETSVYADVVLPAALQNGEAEGILVNGERRVQFSEQAVKPPGAAKPDWEIVQLLARQLGFEKGFAFSSPADVWDEWLRCTTGTYADQTGLARERVKGSSGLQWPTPTVEHPGTPRLFGDGRFTGVAPNRPHAPGFRAVLALPAPSVPPNPPGPGLPFTLITGRYLEHVNTRTRTGMVQELNYAAPRALLDVHPGDAQAHGIRDEDWVSVSSPYGSVTVKARVSDTVPPGVVFLPMHYGRLSDLEGGSDGRGDPESAANLLLAVGTGVNVRFGPVRIRRAEQ